MAEGLAQAADDSDLVLGVAGEVRDLHSCGLVARPRRNAGYRKQCLRAVGGDDTVYLDRRVRMIAAEHVAAVEQLAELAM